jgi:hypothetical protein
LIRLFLDAAQLGSFGRRPQARPVAGGGQRQHPAAGDLLQVKLFERTTRQLRLTEEGEMYRHFSEQAMALMAEAEANLQAGTGACAAW